MGYSECRTKNGFSLQEVASSVQKAIRRGDGKVAGYFAIELFESGYHNYLWKRLLIISAEDCFGIITKEILALKEAFDPIYKAKKADDHRPIGRIFICKAVILLCQVAKSRDADHLNALVPNLILPSDEDIVAAIEDARKNPEPIPDYAFDVHTLKGRLNGKTKKDFFQEEHEALKDRQLGFFDNLVEKK